MSKESSSSRTLLKVLGHTILVIAGFVLLLVRESSKTSPTTALGEGLIGVAHADVPAGK